MLQSMRDKIKGLVAFFLIGLLAIPLALVGVENIFSANNSVGNAAEVDGKVISERDMQIAIAQERQRLQAQFGDNLPADFLSNERLREPVLERLIQRALLANTAEKGDMTLAAKDVDKTIIELPDFQQDGVFNKQRFIQVIRSIGHTSASFRSLLIEDTVVNQLQNALLGTDFATDEEIRHSVALSRQTRDFSWVTLPLEGRPEKIDVSEDEISAHYNDNKQRYLTEEEVAIEYIELDARELAKDITIDEESLQEQYQQEARDFAQAIVREAAHIMVEGDDEAAQNKIATIQEKLKTGEDFAALAAEYSDDFGTKDNGGHLGAVSGDAFPDAFKEALNTLSLNEVSAPVIVNDATHFIKLVAIDENTPPTFEQERARIEADLKRLAAEEQLLSDVEELRDLSYNADNLQEVGDQLSLSVGKTGLFSRSGGKEAILQDHRVLSEAFSDRVLQEKHTSDVIELSPERFVVINIIDRKPVRILTLEEKREDIVDELKVSKAKVELAKEGEEIYKILGEGELGLLELSKEKGIKLSTQVTAQRNTADVPAELLRYIFEMEHPEKDKPIITKRQLENGDYVVVSLTQVAEGRMSDLSEAERKSLRVNLSSNSAQEEYRAWQAYLRADADIDIYAPPAPVL